MNPCGGLSLSQSRLIHVTDISPISIALKSCGRLPRNPSHFFVASLECSVFPVNLALRRTGTPASLIYIVPRLFVVCFTNVPKEEFEVLLSPYLTDGPLLSSTAVMVPSSSDEGLKSAQSSLYMQGSLKNSRAIGRSTLEAGESVCRFYMSESVWKIARMYLPVTAQVQMVSMKGGRDEGSVSVEWKDGLA